MAALIAQLLGETEARVEQYIRSLETGSGRPSVDVRLIAELRQQANIKIRSLGLDSDDTTADELFWALRHKALEDETLLRSCLELNAQDYHTKIAAAMLPLLTNKSWVLKRSAAKKLLSLTPPAQAMKFLGYRSAASMLKNCSVDEILCAASLCEDKQWRDSFRSLLSRLSTADFEYRSVIIRSPQKSRWQELADSGDLPEVMVIELLGSIIVMPPPAGRKLNGGDATALLLLGEITQGYNKIRCSSAFMAFHQTHPDFAAIFHDWSGAYQAARFRMAGVSLTWEQLMFVANQPESDRLLELFEPRLTMADTQLAAAEVLLVHINVGLGWWLKTSYLGAAFAGRVVSMNLADVCGAEEGLPAAGGSYGAGLSGTLWSELLARYALRPNFLNGHISQLDNLRPPAHTKSVTGKSIKKKPLKSKARKV